MAFKRVRRRMKRRPFRRFKRAYRRRRFRRRISKRVFTTFTLLTSQNASSAGEIRADLGFKPTDFTAWLSYATNYERYRIHKAVVKISPGFNVAGGTGASVTDSSNVGDQALLRTPSTSFITTPTYTFAQICNAERVKIRRGFDVMTASCIPNNVSYDVGIVGGVLTPSIGNINYKKWNSTSDRNSEFYTWQWMREAGVGNAVTQYNIYLKIYCEFKERVLPAFNP